MDVISFWIGWAGIWVGIFLALTGLVVAFACAARDTIFAYINGSPVPRATAEAINFSRHMADFIFGEKLFYAGGFVRSVAFSFVVSAVFFTAALLTTPDLLAFVMGIFPEMTISPIFLMG